MADPLTATCGVYAIIHKASGSAYEVTVGARRGFPRVIPLA